MLKNKHNLNQCHHLTKERWESYGQAKLRGNGSSRRAYVGQMNQKSVRFSDKSLTEMISYINRLTVLWKRKAETNSLWR